MAGESVVTCYSGSHYAERPVAFQFAGQSLDVVQVERSWRDPVGVHFVVQASDGRRFRLAYDEDGDAWSVELLGNRRTHL